MDRVEIRPTLPPDRLEIKGDFQSLLGEKERERTDKYWNYIGAAMRPFVKKLYNAHLRRLATQGRRAGRMLGIDFGRFLRLFENRILQKGIARHLFVS